MVLICILFWDKQLERWTHTYIQIFERNWEKDEKRRRRKQWRN